MTLKLSVCVFLYDETLRASITKALQDNAYDVVYLVQPDVFLSYVNRHRQTIDCLLLEATADSKDIFEQLQETEVFLPSVVLLEKEAASKVKTVQQTKASQSEPAESDFSSIDAQNFSEVSNLEGHFGGVYDAAIIYLSKNKLNQLQYAIDQVINRFLKLPPSCTLRDNSHAVDATADEKVQVSFLLQQKRLAEKLKERLGYLSVYYKRNPSSFLRRMPLDERKAFLARLKLDYRKIVLNYFSGDTGLNQKIDNFVSTMFFADVSVSQVVEIHMELMDDFSKQLKIEGRSEEILLDYRLTLIDTLANLCEMYRRSVPREP